MNNSKNLSLHYLALLGVIVLGAVLRFWRLEFKPLWLDEVLTALLSLGERYQDVPLDVLFPLSALQPVFRLQPDISCSEIAQSVATQSTHPPLFFCLMHQWLSWVEPVAQPLSWKLRALPACFGVGAIAAIYYLNRVVFSPTAGLMGAALMAVSPFGVYLSQEARHYTLPMLLITLGLLGLIQIQQAFYFQRQLPRLAVWLSWGIVNSIGCYVHYFFILAFIAQVLTLIGLMYWRRSLLPGGSWLAVGLAIAGVAITYIPWLPMLLGGFGRPETGWLPAPQNIAPLYQTLVGWLLMVIALPVEGQPWWIQIPSGLLMIGFGSWVGWQAWQGLNQLWRRPADQLATLTLLGFTLCVLLQFFAIAYLLGKDITLVPRYNFVYYPAICALLGAGFAVKELKATQIQPSNLQSSTVLLCVSLLSCAFVVSNLVFIKSYNPQQVARDMVLEPTVPTIMVMGYNDLQDVALGLSFALAIDELHQEVSQGTPDASFAFLHRELGYELVWQKLSKLAALPTSRVNLWVVAPGLRRRDYPPQLAIAGSTSCTIDPTQHHRIGVPYQLYRCQ